MNSDFSQHVAGVIAEYNPFHNGHAFHIREAKKRCGASYCIAVMSGDFVQRGGPAIFDKYARTRMALSAGADLVVEMPPIFALASAEDFAACGIALLHHLGVVTHVCFGSECGDTDPLLELARILTGEPEELSRLLKKYTASGLTYPKARQTALSQYLTASGKDACTASLLSSPNNTLGVEYCKALLKRESSMKPVTILRRGAGYHDLRLSSPFASASALRKVLFDRSAADAASCGEPYSRLAPFIPPACREYVNTAVPIALDDFSLLLSYRLLELAGRNENLEKFADVSRDLALRMDRHVFDFSSFQDRIAALKTRQYTYTRISRCLMHILLNITQEDMDGRKRQDYASYIRILGFRRESAELLSAVNRAAGLPLVTKTAHGPRILSSAAFQQFRQDLFCSHVYQSVMERKSGIRPGNEYTSSVVIV